MHSERFCRTVPLPATGKAHDLCLWFLPKNTGFGWGLATALRLSSTKMLFKALNAQHLGESFSQGTPTEDAYHHHLTHAASNINISDPNHIYLLEEKPMIQFQDQRFK